MLRPVALIFSLFSITTAFAITPVDTSNQLIVSVRDQKLMLVQNGGKIATYPVSTSMFGLGDSWGRMTTPLGNLTIEKKIGDNVPVGAVFHNRRLTGEILQPNAPGRDPVTTRIMWLRGLEAQNAHAFQRCIYIHGTPEEKKLGRPASYGCIRMKASDIADLYNRVPPGALVQITPDSLPKLAQAKVPRSEMSNAIVAAAPPPQIAAPPQIQAQNRDPLPKVAKVPRPQATNTVVAATTLTTLTAPPEHLTLNEPEAQKVTDSHQTENHQTRAREKSGSLTVDQMRMSGALAAQRQKSKLTGVW
jgi:lipoprotein-anchoring transpeptidase ErfK/SrfK